MKTKAILAAAVLGCASWAVPVQVPAQATSETPEGVLCLTPVPTGGFVSVRLSVAKDKGLLGVRWYNNDGTVAFPTLVLSPAGDGEPQFEGGVAAAQAVAGLTSEWSEVLLDRPLATEAKAVDVIFEVAQGSELVARGAGGGTAFGYRREQGGPTAFISQDGREWTRLRSDCRLLIEPVLVPRDGEMAVLGAPGKALSGTGAGVSNALHPPRPNPANPSVTIAFSLAEVGPVDLSIFDLRGRQVATISTGQYGPGTHEVRWEGRDSSGRLVSSGAYFARLKVGSRILSRRLLLVR